MKIVVTGSFGFIGSALVSYLCADGVKTYSIDIRFPRWHESHLEDHGVDINYEGAALIEMLRSLNRSHARES